MADSPSMKSKLGLDSNCMKLKKHLSKSASELSSTDVPRCPPQRVKSAGTQSVSSVLQRTHGFFSSLRTRISRGRSKDRGRKSPNGADQDVASDYAEDSSDHSLSTSPLTQSPRHRIENSGTSPLASKSHPFPKKKTDNFKVAAKLERQSSMARESIESVSEETLLRRELELRKYSFFQLKIHLISGQNLVAMDKSGTSDPYVKFKVGGRLLHRSKTIHKDLNPKWDEKFTIPIEDPFQPINIKVFDYDWGLQDDFMGTTKLFISSLDIDVTKEFQLKLEDPSNPERNCGEIKCTVLLIPKTQEDKEQKNPKLADASRRLKSQIWSSVVTIVLVESKNLSPEVDASFDEIFVKFRLGNEKYKSKGSSRRKWLEQFDLHLFDDDQTLEIVVCGKYNSYGRAVIELTKFTRECTHTLWQPLEESKGEVLVMLTISGTTSSETISDLTTHREDPNEIEAVLSRYSWRRVFENTRDIGHLTVKVYGASGLASADLGGKSDPFCVLELGNSRLQTQTEYKTLSPNWNKIFTFNVKDITSILEVTVYDEDRDHKVEFLGKIAIPLLRIRNGEKRWYALKDKKLFAKAKGNNAQILLELSVVYSALRAAIRVVEPKEEKLIQQEIKFKRQLFMRNVARFKKLIVFFFDVGQFIQSCLDWESPLRSLTALTFWICGCIWFDISTIPAVLLLYLIKNWIVNWLTGSSLQLSAEESEIASDDEDEDERDKEEKKTIKERLQAIQEASQTVQNTIGRLSSMGESIKNIFNFAVPEISWLTAIVLFVACLILHYIPLRAILLAWGLLKFSKRIIRPHAVPNNEVLDLLSRVPDDDELVMYRELTLHVHNDCSPASGKRDPKKKQK